MILMMQMVTCKNIFDIYYYTFFLLLKNSYSNKTMLTGISLNLRVNLCTHGFLKTKSVCGSLQDWAYLRDF